MVSGRPATVPKRRKAQRDARSGKRLGAEGADPEAPQGAAGKPIRRAARSGQSAPEAPSGANGNRSEAPQGADGRPPKRLHGRGWETDPPGRKVWAVGSGSALGRGRKPFGSAARRGRAAPPGGLGRARENRTQRGDAQRAAPEAASAVDGNRRERRKARTTGPEAPSGVDGKGSGASQGAHGPSPGSGSNCGTAAGEPVNGGIRSAGTQLRSSDPGCGTRRAAHAAVRVQCKRERLMDDCPARARRHTNFGPLDEAAASSRHRRLCHVWADSLTNVLTLSARPRNAPAAV